MSDIVIKAENLGKKYIIGHQAERGGYTALRDVLMQNARTLWSKTKDLAKGKAIIQGDTFEEVWALKDVNFDIRRGEAVGIIGRNGAGKSTLLKVLSRITEPTTGRVTIKGRVASLLEVGTGFHPELTGRENIYMNGTILGMTRKEIKRKFDEIVAFAEVEKYLDTPVKRYSSGMYVRLAFAVAAHLEPEILVVDEVLAVGDVTFQKKCLGKMDKVAKGGRTVLFVSHNMNSIAQLCDKTILLEKGAINGFGDTNKIINQYMNYSTEKRSLGECINKGKLGSDYLAPLRIVLLDENNNINNKIKKGDILRVLIEFNLLKVKDNLTIGISIFDLNGNHLFRSLTTDADPASISKYRIGMNIIELCIPTDILNEGSYLIVFDGSLYMTSWDFNPLSNQEFAVRFDIEGGFTFSPFWRVKRAGICAPVLRWRINNDFSE